MTASRTNTKENHLTPNFFNLVLSKLISFKTNSFVQYSNAVHKIALGKLKKKCVAIDFFRTTKQKKIQNETHSEKIVNC